MSARATAAFVVVLAALSPGGAAASFIPPGHESEIAAAVGRAAGTVPGAEISGISIDRDVIRVEAIADDGSSSTLTIAAPTCAGCPPLVSRAEGEPAGALGAALERELAPLAAVLWTVDGSGGDATDDVAVVEDAAPQDDASFDARLAWIDRGVFAAVLLWAVVRIAHGLRSAKTSVDRTGITTLAAALVAFAVVAAWGPAWGVLHEHAAFVFRNDCARSLTCSRASGWSPTFFHVYGPVLRLLPRYDELSIERTSLAFTTLALGLFYALVRKLAAPHVRSARAQRIALFSLGFAAASPVVLRLAVSDTPWPFALCLVLGAGLFALDARDGAPSSVVPAIALVVLGALTSHAMIGLLVLPAVAWLAWARRRPSPSGLLGAAVTLAALALLHGSDVAAVLSSSAATSMAGGAWRSVRLLPLDPAFTSVVAIAMTALGALAATRMRAVWTVPILAAGLVTWLPATLLSPWDVAWPTRVLFALPETLFFAVLPALGADAACSWVSERLGERAERVTAVAIALLTVLSLPQAVEGRRLALERDTVAREIDAIDAMLPLLPDAEVLAIPDPIQPVLEGLSLPSDPVEVQFPFERARSVLGAAHGRAPRIVYLSALLARPRDRGDVVVYVGTSLQSFLRAELDAELVPWTLERPQLGELRASAELEPIATRTLEVSDHPLLSTRVRADREPTVDIGFYRWRWREE